METPIFRNFLPLSHPLFFALQWPIRIVVIKSPKQGAQTPLHLLLTSNRTTGQYFTDCKLALSSPISTNDKVAHEYYNLTLEVLGDVFSSSEC